MKMIYMNCINTWQVENSIKIDTMNVKLKDGSTVRLSCLHCTMNYIKLDDSKYLVNIIWEDVYILDDKNKRHYIDNEDTLDGSEFVKFTNLYRSFHNIRLLTYDVFDKETFDIEQVQGQLNRVGVTLDY